MNPRTKAILALVTVLLIGIVLGVVLGGAFQRFRRDRIERVRRPGGFVAHMEEIIRPRDQQQRAALRPILESTEKLNERIVLENAERMRGALESMLEELRPLLDEGQIERLERFARRPHDPRDPAARPPGPGGPPPDRPPR